MDILINLTTLLVPLLLGYFIGKTRDNNKILFDKKLIIYSDIVYYLNSAKYLRFHLEGSKEKLLVLTKKITSLQTNDPIKPIHSLHADEMDNIINELDNDMDLLDQNDELIRLFAPARLIGSKAVVNELREYFSLVSKFHLMEKKDQNVSIKKISKSVMILEQLMRKDLSNFKILSKQKIISHLEKQ